MIRIVRSRRPAALAALALLLVAQLGVTALASAYDVLPFRLLYGRPPPIEGAVPAKQPRCDIWLEGGRLQIRLEPGPLPTDIQGRLRLDDGSIKDVQIGSEAFHIRQGQPDRLMWQVPLAKSAETLSVTLSGNFKVLALELTIDGRKIPSALRIGERAAIVRSLPLRLDLGSVQSDWIERFGFQ